MEESVTHLEQEVSLGNFGRWEEAPASPMLVNSGNQSKFSSCRICLSNILDPARLVCGHKFCETCLNKYWKANEEPNFVVCPLCRDYNFKIGFVQKNYAHSTRDFRRKFDPHHVDLPSIQSKTDEVQPQHLSSWYMRILPIVLLPVVCLVGKLVKPIFLDMFRLFSRH